jgi:hypothetical protein
LHRRLGGIGAQPESNASVATPTTAASLWLAVIEGLPAARNWCTAPVSSSDSTSKMTFRVGLPFFSVPMTTVTS